jgi:hypothetical protein
MSSLAGGADVTRIRTLNFHGNCSWKRQQHRNSLLRRIPVLMLKDGSCDARMEFQRLNARCGNYNCAARNAFSCNRTVAGGWSIRGASSLTLRVTFSLLRNELNAGVSGYKKSGAPALLASAPRVPWRRGGVTRPDGQSKTSS